jgi:two-component system chemotaxis response regulator CheB
MLGIAIIGASTGAPRTHHLYLEPLPPEFTAPIVIVQHMPLGPFIDGMLRYLHDNVSAPAKLARDGDALRPREILLAEPGFHVRFAKTGSQVCVSMDKGENTFAPSMNVTFSSAAEVFGRRSAVAMISGLHAHIDGLEGCQAVRRAGGTVIVTSRETTPCYHMVEHVRKAAAFDIEAPLPHILSAMSRSLRS